MSAETHLIVLSTTKYGDNSLVLHSLSREFGRKGFLVRVGKKAGTALFLPLNILEGKVNEKSPGSLQTLGKIAMPLSLNGIRGNIYKNTMTLFMSEVLYRTLKEGAVEEGLYDWCEKAIVTLDSMERDFSNFHVRFLLDLATALGFSPSYSDLAPFARGSLTELERFTDAKTLAQAMLVPLSGEGRSALCECLLSYLEYHTEARINIRSLKILQELYR